MSKSKESAPANGGSGCGCLSIIVFILVIWALLFGLPVNDKTLDIDIIPPAVRYQ